MSLSRALVDASGTGRPFPEPGVAPHYAPDRSCVLLALDIGLKIDPVAQTLEGDTVVTLGPLPSGRFVASVEVGELTVDAVTTVEGEALEWRREGDQLFILGLPDSGGQARILTHGRPSRGLYFTGPTAYAPDRKPMAWTQCQDEDGHHVFPCHDHPGLRAPVTLRIQAPETLTVVANGALKGVSRAQGGWRTWTWIQAEAIPAYLVVVVVGDLDVHESSADNGDRGPLPVRYIVPQGTDPAVVERVFHKTPRMISHFAKVFGVPYPWARYDQVVVHEFIFGGMENVCATVLTDLTLTDDRAALDRDADDLIAHELAHQWFGDLVTCQDWSQAWLNEGWATWSEFIWASEDLGADEADLALWGKLQGYLGEDGGRYQRAITHYRFRNPIDLFDRHLYEKGGLVLQTLHATLGDDAFWAGVHSYLRRFACGSVHTRDFQRELERASGRNLDGFFQQFVHGAGHPVLKVSLDKGEELLTVTVKQTQSGPDVAEVFHFPLQLRLVAEDGSVSELRLPVAERERTWAIPIAAAPARVEVDPRLRVLAALSVKAPKDWLIASLKADSGVVGRIRAARALGKDGSGAAVAALADALRTEPFWGVRAEIAEQLGSRGDAPARAALLAGLSDPHPKARRAVVAALGHIHHPEAVAALDALATDAGDPSLLVVAEAARALGAQRADSLLPRCRALLDAHSWGKTLEKAGLAGLGASRSVAALPDLLQHSQDRVEPAQQAAAASALGQLAEEFEPARRDAVDRLMQLAAVAPFRVRLSAISALGQAGDPRATAVLSAVHQGDPDGRVARTAYEALRRLRAGDKGGRSDLSRLQDALQELREENRGLRARLDKLEARLDPPAPEPSPSGS